MQFKPCLWCIYIGLAHYYSIVVGYSFTSLYTCSYIYIANTDAECMRAIASTLIHAVVLCESAQRYRALMVILQLHVPAKCDHDAHNYILHVHVTKPMAISNLAIESSIS